MRSVTGRAASVREFVQLSFNALNIPVSFEGKGDEEIGINENNGRKIVSVSKDFYRPAEVDLLIGDPTRAEKILNWQSKTKLDSLCTMMVRADLARNSAVGITGI